jgi:predicted O-methyltransferase YrrM
MFEQIIKIEDGPVKYELSGRGHVKMQGHEFPLSIKQEEFDFLTNLVKDNNLQRGFECATAFGISSLASALGFKETGGKLVTMDAYIEEKCRDAGMYKDFERQVYEQADGYKSVKHLVKHFGLENTLFPEIGWSPNDVEETITKHYGDKKLDFVFLDAGHFPDQMIKDISAIAPYLDKKFVFVFHDIYSWSFDEEVHKLCRDLFDKDVEIKVPHPQGENLGYIWNL